MGCFYEINDALIFSKAFSNPQGSLTTNKTCLLQWSSTFTYTEDAVSKFYKNGFKALVKKFGELDRKTRK